MKKYFLYTVFVTVISGCFFASCEDAFGDFLDKQPSNELTEEETFSTWKNFEAFHYDIYDFLRDGLGRINSSWMDSATDLAQTSYSWGGTRTSFNIGNYYASSGAPEINDTWNYYYRAIRKCNMVLERVNDVPLGPDETSAQRKEKADRLVCEARMFRAYFYWELVLRYGAVPIIENSLDPDKPNLDIKRPESVKTCFEFILKDLNESYAALLDDDAIADADLGRLTKGINLALQSRIKLYLASPRYQSLGLVSWQQAANAAELFITTYGDKGSNRYHLFTDVDPVKAYQVAINRRAFDGNRETIFCRNDGFLSNWWPSEAPVGYGGSGGLCPSQNLVDMYDMANGTSPFAQYDETGAVVYANGIPTVNSASGYDELTPYLNRDPRLYATVLYNGAVWWHRAIDVTEGGTDKPIGNANATPTGYYNRKYMDDTSTDPLDGNKVMYRNWIFIRYAEILLNYAEAMNEVKGPSPEVFGILQQLRDRVGMTAKLAGRSDLQNKDNLRKFIRKERTVELAFEDHRSWDVRRWNVAKEALSSPIYGVTVTKQGSTVNYKRKLVQQRVFDDKMYLYPIPEKEIWKTGMQNNPGW